MLKQPTMQSLVHLSVLKTNVTTVSNRLMNAMFIMLALLAVSMVPNTVVAQTQLKQEVVTGAFEQKSISLADETQIILRDSRLEFSNTNAELDDMFFLVFANAARLQAKPGRILSTSSEKIANESMARVLKTDEMKVNILSDAVYAGVYPGVDVEVKATNNGALLTFTANDPANLEQVALWVWGAQHRLASQQEFEIQGKGPAYRVYAKSGQFLFNGDKGLYQLRSSGEQTVTLQISAK